MGALQKYVAFPGKRFFRSPSFVPFYSDKWKEMIVKIKGREKTEEQVGTGFVILVKQDMAYLLTADHVIRSESGQLARTKKRRPRKF